MILRVGHAELVGSFERYCEHLDLLEVRSDAGHTPRRARLTQLKEAAPESFCFSVVVPPALCALEEIADAEIERVRAVADALSAEWLVVRTPSSVRPGQRTTKRLADLLERLQGYRVAWEPSGLFDDSGTNAVAESLGVTLVRDLSRVDAPPGDVIYTRLRALGSGGRLPASAAEQVAEAIAEASAAYVVVDAPGAKGIARELREMLGSDD